MERVEDAAFGPTDRIGQLTMRNLDIADSREKLEIYASQGILGGASAELVGELKAGQAGSIPSIGRGSDNSDAVLERAAFDLGTD